MNRPAGLAAQVEDARRELQLLLAAARDLTGKLQEAQRQAAQARALVEEEADVAVRMERLEPVLDLAAVTRHARQAIAGARIVEGPVRCAVVEGLLPDAVHRAAVEAIPSPVFVGDRHNGSTGIAVPPRLAPTYVVATWLFLNDVAKDLIGPALVERFTAPSAALDAPLRLSRSQLVRHDPHPSQGPGARQGEVLALVVHLNPSGPNLAWAFPAGAADGVTYDGPWSEAAGAVYQWRVGFKQGAPQGSRPRRRHGDLASWIPGESAGR